jgi:hypothetical protein
MPTTKRGKRSALVAGLADLGVSAKKSARVKDLEELLLREKGRVAGDFGFEAGGVEKNSDCVLTAAVFMQETNGSRF